MLLTASGHWILRDLVPNRAKKSGVHFPRDLCTILRPIFANKAFPTISEKTDEERRRRVRKWPSRNLTSPRHPAPQDDTISTNGSHARHSPVKKSSFEFLALRISRHLNAHSG